MAAFLDVSGAFDYANVDILLAKLRDVGCSDSVLSFVQFIMYGRRVYATCLNVEFRRAYRGVPQGGLLSPLLYVLYISGITGNIGEHIEVSQYADDVAVYVKC